MQMKEEEYKTSEESHLVKTTEEKERSLTH
jgi:hypothetical protein